MLLLVSPTKSDLDVRCKDAARLAKTAIALGWNVYSNFEAVPPYLYHSRGAVYGELAFCELVADRMNWKLLSNNFDWMAKLPEEYAPKDATVFTSEYVCFVKDRSVISACCHWLKAAKMAEPQVNLPENYTNNHDAIVEFVNKVLQDERVSCVSGSVINVARYKKDTYTVTYTTPAWASPIYGCEMVGALEAIKASCVPKEENK